MPPRKRSKHIQASTSTRRTRGAQDVRNNPHSRAVNLDTAVEYNGPITRFRAWCARTNVSSLPLEVLGEIFILTVPAAQESHERLMFYSPRVTNPLRVCAVCSSWRSLAFSMPQLWKRVHIYFPAFLKESQGKEKAALLVQWIERSCSLPLTLYMSCNLKHGYRASLSETGPEAPILSVLKEYAARWESVYSNNPFPLDARWNTLRFIWLRFPCPALFAAENSAASWPQLTHLQIESKISYQEADALFTTCPNLVQLSISVDSSDMIPTAPKAMHNLVTFSLGVLSSEHRRILRQLSLPSLREFSIGNSLSDDIDPLLDLFTRSRCVLDILEIYGVWTCALAGFPRILSHQSCSSLSSLTLDPRGRSSPAEGDELLRRLTLGQNDTLCANLKYLSISDAIPTLSSSTLLNMIESRVCSPDESTLQCLQLHLGKEFPGLDEVRIGPGINYSRTKFPGCLYLVSYQRPGCRKPANPTEPIYEI